MKRDVIVIGGGVIGLSIAYNILKLKPNLKVVVLEQKYIGYGASTRNASHIRVHFWSEENARFAVESWRLMAKIASELKWNPLRYLGGYLWLVYDEEILKAYEDMNERLWSRLGFPVKILDRSEVKRRYPYINTNGLYMAVFGPQDGKIHHDFITYGYYYGIKKLGGKVLEYTPAIKIRVEREKVIGVETTVGFLESDKVIVAAGAWSRKLFNDIGLDLPLEPARKEIFVSEPTKPFIKPLIVDMREDSKGLYICQTQRGEVMGSIDYPEVKNTFKFTNTLRWMATFSRLAIRLIPTLRRLRFLRLWSGNYNMSPDHSHILGRDDEWPDGLYVATGFSGHGFMMAPYTGVVMAKYIVEGIIPELMKPYLPSRFREGRLIKETMVIG